MDGIKQEYFNYPELTDESIIEGWVFERLFSIEDELEQSEALAKLQLAAKRLGCKQIFDQTYKSYLKAQNRSRNSWDDKSEPETNFIITDEDEQLLGICNLKCGSWKCDESGVRCYNVIGLEQVASRKPILLSGLMKNEQTGEEIAKISYKKRSSWYTIPVPKETISTASKIVGLSKYGVQVTSENAKYLVNFLSDLEWLNEDLIEVHRSTSKLGWHGANKELFIPYDTGIEFDAESRFKSLFEAIKPVGSYQLWLSHMKELRATGRKEIKIMLASSFASVLVSKLGNLPFFVDLWGETEGGKTVSLMVAASVWGNPAESQYIGDFKTTDTALEARADMLANLPVILDDSSKASKRIRDNFESVVYDLCSGKGKSRSNKELGVNRELRWSSCFLCNGERKLSEYTSQGGAINRIIEVSCGQRVYKDPAHTANLLKANYGHAGKLFVDVLKELDGEYIEEIYDTIFDELKDDDKMSKQIASLCTILTADKLATDYIFCDGEYITIEDVQDCLIDRKELSDNERAYTALIDHVNMAERNFADDLGFADRHGWFGDFDGKPYIIYIKSAFSKFCAESGFSESSFVKWLREKGLLILSKDGKSTKTKKLNGTVLRCYYIQLPTEESEGNTDADGYVYYDGVLPFDEK